MGAVTTGKFGYECIDSSFNRYSGYHCTGESGNVVVYANEHKDAQRVVDILECCGYVSQACMSAAAEPERPSNFGAVVCHRVDQDIAAIHLLRLSRANRIVVLSDCLEESTIVSLLKSGAHHHFNLEESAIVLQARLQAALRVHSANQLKSLEIDDILFDTQKRAVRRAGQCIELSPKEYELALYLFSNIDRVISNGELMNSVWSLPPYMDSRRIDTAACRVRKKLGLSSQLGWELKRIRMVGYRLKQLEGGIPTQNVESLAC